MADRTEDYSKKFLLVQQAQYETAIPVYKYKCLRTGMTIVFGDVEGPTVSGHFALATETHDDDGIPHILEYLIFLGSEQYPFKGALNIFADHCFASDINAWTKVDHTHYTFKTIGSEGFFLLLLVYLDCIFYPTLKSAGFLTHVHHITREAKDAGVVYCEMEQSENTAESIVMRSLLRKIYPGKCGYKSEIGGILSNLRESTTIEKIRKYHHEFYRPDNLLLVVSGKMDHYSVFDALELFIQKILSNRSREGYVRPWQNSIDPLTKSFSKMVPFPSYEKTHGMISIGFRGPSVMNNYSYIACQLLLKYLTSSPISPIPYEMIEISDPFCSKISVYMPSHKEPIICINFENVPIEKMDAEVIPSKLVDVFDKLMHDDYYFDLEVLRTFIERYKYILMSNLDSHPHESLASTIITDFLYGNNNGNDLQQGLNKISVLNQLHNEDIAFWKGMLDKYFVNCHRVIIMGKPSIKKLEELAKEEEERIQERKESLGEEGLKKKAIELFNAELEYVTRQPKEISNLIRISNVDCIKFHEYHTYTTNSINQNHLFKITKAPIYMEVLNIKSSCVYMNTFINTKDLQMNLRMYLPIVIDLLMTSTVVYNGVKIHHTDITDEIGKDLIQWNTGIGFSSSSRIMCGVFSSVVSLYFQLEPMKFNKGIKWLQTCLFNKEINKEEFSISLLKVLNEVLFSRKHADRVLKDILHNMIYIKDNNINACGVWRQYKFLKNLHNIIKSDEGWASVKKDLNNVKLILTNPNNLKMHVSADLGVLCEMTPNISFILETLFPPNTECCLDRSFETVFDFEYILPNNQCTLRACAVGMSTVRSSYFIQVTKCICDYDHPDMAALLVLLTYFTQLKGPMWRNVYGNGYAYSYNIIIKPNEALIKLYFYQSVNVPAAYKETKSMFKKHFNNSAIWDQTLFESAKCSMISETVDKEKSIGHIMQQSILHQFRNLSTDNNRTLVKNISKVALEELPEIGKKYVLPLFHQKSTRIAMVCPSSELEDIADEFKNMRIDMTIYKSLDEFYLNNAL